MVSGVWRTLAKTQLRKYSLYEPQKFLWQRLTRRNFWDNDSPAEISETTTHRQKFLRQGSTEISGTTVQRNFWDNDPQKFLGRLERINFWGPFCRKNFWGPYCRRNFWDPFWRRNFWGSYCRRNFWDPSGPPKYLRQRFDCRNVQDHWTSKMSKYHLVCSKKCPRYTEDRDIDLHRESENSFIVIV